MTQEIIQRRGDRLFVSAPMVQSNVTALLAAGKTSFEARLHVVDLTAVPQADSSALAVLFAWVRAAEAQGRQLRFTNLPPGMAALADLYGVRQTLPLL
jgi:phospholipid transport system transporter-binding protein